MSGHVIATPLLMPALQSLAPVLAGIAAGTGGTCAAVGLAFSVKRAIDMQAAAALEHRCEERSKLAEWAAFQARQQQRLAALQTIERAFQETEQRLLALEIGQPVTAKAGVPTAGPDGPVSRSLSLGRDCATPEQVRQMLDDLRHVLTSLPADFRGAKNSPHELLQRHFAAMSAQFQQGGKIPLSDLNLFRETILRTLADFRSEVASRRAHMQVVGRRLESCLNEVLFYEHFAASPGLDLGVEQSELAVLRTQITMLLGSEEVTAGATDVIEKKLTALKRAVDEQVVYAAHRQELPQSLTAHLVEMGYGLLENFDESDDGALLKSTLRIPGGEQLRVVLHRNGQLAFEVVHERDAAAGADAGLTEEESQFLERQELRWCRDMRELIRRLASEGYPFVVDFEQSIPGGTAKVVVVETPEEILAYGEEGRNEGASRRRYLA